MQIAVLLLIRTITVSSYTFLLPSGKIEIKTLIGSQQIRLAIKTEYPILKQFRQTYENTKNLNISNQLRSGETKTKLSEIILAWMEIKHKTTLLTKWHRELNNFKGLEKNFDNKTCQLLQSNIQEANIRFLIDQLKTAKQKLITNRLNADWHTNAKSFLFKLIKHLNQEEKSTITYLKLLNGLKYKLPALTILELNQLSCLPVNFQITRTDCRKTSQQYDCLINIQIYNHRSAEEFIPLVNLKRQLDTEKYLYVTNDSIYSANCPNQIICPPKDYNVEHINCIKTLLQNEFNDINDCDFIKNKQKFRMTKKGLILYTKGSLIYNNTKIKINKTSLIQSNLAFNFSNNQKTYLFPKNHVSFKITESNITNKQLAMLNNIIWLDNNINPIYRNYFWSSGLIFVNVLLILLVYIMFFSLKKLINRIKYIRVSRNINKTNKTPQKPYTLHYLARLK